MDEIYCLFSLWWDPREQNPYHTLRGVYSSVRLAKEAAEKINDYQAEAWGIELRYLDVTSHTPQRVAYRDGRGAWV